MLLTLNGELWDDFKQFYDEIHRFGIPIVSASLTIEEKQILDTIYEKHFKAKSGIDWQNERHVEELVHRLYIVATRCCTSKRKT